MSRIIKAVEVSKNNNAESCWIVLYGTVYDVSGFLRHHPGGSKIILQLAGHDATEKYDPVHPPGILETHSSEILRLGKYDPGPRPEQKMLETQAAALQDEEETPMEQVLNLEEMEEIGTRKLTRRTWAYYFSAADDLLAKRMNNEVYRSILLRPRIFIDCERCDVSTTLLGCKVGLPIFISPAAMARLAHPSGEAGIAQACSRFGALQIISNNASLSPEQIVADAEPGQSFGWQLYVQSDLKRSEDMFVRINKLSDKIKFICLTLDAPVPGKREHDERSSSVTSKLPVRSATQAGVVARPGGGGINQQLSFGISPKLTWKKTLPWLAKHTSLPIVLKGIQTHEDAYLATQYAPQVQGIGLSNHGGRGVENAPPAIHTLLEIRKYCPEVLDKVEIFVDGGIKRGTDVVKALCLGARGVGIGRAALWGLGAGGPAGVERTLEILKDELERAMRLLGASNVAELGPQHVNTRVVESQIYDGPAGLEEYKTLSKL
ncbi:MAG: hypothetical protein MMC33_007588 [Icmadophila ericetorum]|nr:hypothetical protein [Icmadophila ericetorum]